MFVNALIFLVYVSLSYVVAFVTGKLILVLCPKEELIFARSTLNMAFKVAPFTWYLIILMLFVLCLEKIDIDFIWGEIEDDE